MGRCAKKEMVEKESEFKCMFKCVRVCVYVRYLQSHICVSFKYVNELKCMCLRVRFQNVCVHARVCANVCVCVRAIFVYLLSMRMSKSVCFCVCVFKMCVCMQECVCANKCVCLSGLFPIYSRIRFEVLLT